MFFYFNDGGCIVNIFLGLMCFLFLGLFVYVVMKGVIEVFICYFVWEFGDRKIIVNIVVFGVIVIDFGGGWVRDNEDINRYIVLMIVLGRVG